jgi:xylulokinase
LSNRYLGGSIHNLNFNIHTQAHVLRAAQEGIVFALNYGLDIMRNMGITIRTIRAGSANMFLSPIFASAFATVTNSTIELYNTDGSQGAARGAGIGVGIFRNSSDAFEGLKITNTIEPDTRQSASYKLAYRNWLRILENTNL